MRKIKLIGEVNEEMFKQFCEELDVMTEKSNKPVTVELCSEGGTALDALAIVGRMRTSPCDIIVMAYGKVMSAAVLILAAGTKRRMSSEAWIMYHEDFIKVKGSTTDIFRMSNRVEQEEQQWADLLQKYTGRAASQWRAFAKQTTYFSATDALKVGLIDEIIGR